MLEQSHKFYRLLVLTGSFLVCCHCVFKFNKFFFNRLIHLCSRQISVPNVPGVDCCNFWVLVVRCGGFLSFYIPALNREK